MNYFEALSEALNHMEFVREFDRLNGTNLMRRGSPIELAVDMGTGRYESDVKEFVAFFDEYVWQPLIENQLATTGETLTETPANS